MLSENNNAEKHSFCVLTWLWLNTLVYSFIKFFYQPKQVSVYFERQDQPADKGHHRRKELLKGQRFYFIFLTILKLSSRWNLAPSRFQFKTETELKLSVQASLQLKVAARSTSKTQRSESVIIVGVYDSYQQQSPEVHRVIRRQRQFLLPPTRPWLSFSPQPWYVHELIIHSIDAWRHPFLEPSLWWNAVVKWERRQSIQ